MNRAQARQIYLSLTDEDFENLARNQTRWKIRYVAVSVLTWLGGVITGIAIMQTWFR